MFIKNIKNFSFFSLMSNKRDTFWNANDESDEDFESILGINTQNQKNKPEVEPDINKDLHLEENCNDNLREEEKSDEYENVTDLKFEKTEENYVEFNEMAIEESRNEINTVSTEVNYNNVNTATEKNYKDFNKKKNEVESAVVLDKMNIIWSDDEGDFPLNLGKNTSQIENCLQDLKLDKCKNFEPTNNSEKSCRFENIQNHNNVEIKDHQNLEIFVEQNVQECFFEQKNNFKNSEDIYIEEDEKLEDENVETCFEGQNFCFKDNKYQDEDFKNVNYCKDSDFLISKNIKESENLDKELHLIQSNADVENEVVLDKINILEEQYLDNDNCEPIDNKILKKETNLEEETAVDVNSKDNIKRIIKEDNLNKTIIESNEITKTENIKEKNKVINNFPLVCTIGKFIFTNSYIKQKRISRSGNQTEVNVNISKSYKVDIRSKYDKSKFVPRNDVEIKIFKMLDLKEINMDIICEILEVKDVVYSDANYGEHISISDINIILNLNNINVEMALDYCLKKNMNIFYMIFGGDKKLILQKIVNDNMKCLYDDSKFTEKWSKYFKHILRDKSLVHKFINCYKTDKDLILILAALHFLDIIDMGKYINNIFLFIYYIDILLLVHKIKKVFNLDLLIYEYIKFIRTEDINLSKEIYKENRKILRSVIQKELDEFYKLNWNFGIKDVLTFGINKILIDDNEKKNENKNYENKFEVQNNVNMSADKIQNLKIIKNNLRVDKNSDNNFNVKFEKNTEEKNIYSKESKPSEENYLYKNEEHSKSFVDTFNVPSQPSEYKTEDDTSLFLSKYNLDIDSKEPTKKESENSSIFNIFNLFKKKSYKIDLESSEDIKYDPVTKKWVSNNTPTNNLTSKNKSVELPKPSLERKKKENLTSLYAGKKSVVKQFSTFKKIDK